MLQRILNNTWTFVSVAVVSALIVTLLVLQLCPPELVDWLLALAATSISALFAVAVGIGLFNRQTKLTDKQRRQQLAEVLVAEIMDIKDVLSETGSGAWTWFKTESGNAKRVLLPEGLEFITFDEAVRSGLFSTPDTVRIMTLVGGLRGYNSRVQRAQAILQAEIIDKEKIESRNAGYLLDRNADNLEQHRKKVLEECERMVARLKQLQG